MIRFDRIGFLVFPRLFRVKDFAGDTWDLRGDGEAKTRIFRVLNIVNLVIK